MKESHGCSSGTWDGMDRWYRSRNQCPSIYIRQNDRKLFLSDAYLSLQQGEQTTTKQGLSIKRRPQVMGIITAGWYISHPQKGSESIIVQAVCGQEVLVELVTGASPEVTNLLGLDITWSKRRTFQWRSGNLQDWKRRCIGSQWFGDSRNRRNKWRQGQTLRKGDQACRRA